MKQEALNGMTWMERPFDDFFRVFVGPRSRKAFPTFLRHLEITPATDVFARNGDLVVRAELPGIDPAKDVTVNIENGDLMIRGQRTKREDIKEEAYYRMEASYGAFERHVWLPEGITEKDVEAEYKDGVLEVVVHGATKSLEASEQKAIPIRTGVKAKA
jgi:HSP20 family protein